ncbi:MAG: class I SAM-dependent methyltransferase [Pseudomonadota bacterium]
MNLYDALPNESLNTVGLHEDLEQFKQVGSIVNELLATHCALVPDSSVLDIGCGIGRIAIALTDALSSQGRYRGFDITPDAIAWCSREITPRHPQFQFVLSDVFNSSYNPGGQLKPEEYVFPYDEGVFDIAIATSVFTHLPYRAMRNYVKEMHRVLKPGGKALATLFLLDGTARTHIEQAQSTLNFVHALEGCMVIDFAVPEKAVAFDLEEIQSILRQQGFRTDWMKMGGWSGRAIEGPDYYQDLLILTKE